MTLEEIRAAIDDLDRRMVALIGDRFALVQQAATHKKSAADVAAPARVEQVIQKVRARAEEVGAPPALVEAIYRAMIAELVALELAAWRAEQR
jgi:isochorismate pyruvate lyase